jgi:ketosteroid isomerase-like protein
MSRENVEVGRGIYDAVARRDGVTPFEAYSAEIVWDLSNSRRTALGVEPIYRGHEGVREFWRDALSVFAEVDLEVEELIDAGDRVVAVTRERGVGRGSGVLVRSVAVSVWTLKDRKVVQVQVFDERQQALEAAGLRE